METRVVMGYLMLTLWSGLGLGLILLLVAMVLLVKAVDRWLERQSPVGVGIAQTDSGKVKLQFEGGPREGLYKQLTESGDTQSREFGHWMVEGETLRIIILATDVRDHPRFGTDVVYQLTYLSLLRKPMPRIQIDGPDRPKIVYGRAKEGVTVDIGPAPDLSTAAHTPPAQPPT